MTMTTLWRQTIALWHSHRNIDRSRRSSDISRHAGGNVACFQETLRMMSVSGLHTFPSVIETLTTRFYLANDDDQIIISLSRAILEVFVLYSIATGDYIWVWTDSSRDLEQQIGVLSSLIHYPTPSSPLVGKSYQWMAENTYAKSVRSRIRAQIIRDILQLVGTVSNNTPFAIYDQHSSEQRCNAAALLKEIKLKGPWFSMAWSLATKDLDAPPDYGAYECPES